MLPQSLHLSLGERNQGHQAGDQQLLSPQTPPDPTEERMADLHEATQKLITQRLPATFSREAWLIPAVHACALSRFGRI